MDANTIYVLCTCNLDLEVGYAIIFPFYFLSTGGTDKLIWRTMISTDSDVYINNLDLELTDEKTMSPVYYVSIIAVNGAGLESSPVSSTPIRVVQEDRAG